MKPRVLVMKTGSTLPPVLEHHGDFEWWIADGMGVAVEDLDVCSVHEGEALPPAEAPAGVVVTGSPAMVSAREPWSEAAAAWLVEAGGGRDADLRNLLWPSAPRPRLRR